jgi:hypothetical protein
VSTKEGCVSYGFLLAQPVRKLKAELAEIQSTRTQQLEPGSLESEPLG